MKNIAMVALMLNLGVAGVYAQEMPVKMRFQGTGGPSRIDLKQPNASTVEESVAGNGTLGRFTFMDIRASLSAPQVSAACSSLYFPSVAGAGAGQFRFQDGSLLKVELTQGGDCIDPVQMMARCILTFKVTGGTGRFKNASGVLTYDETARPLLADALNNPVLASETGEITGTISGLAMEIDQQDRR